MARQCLFFHACAYASTVNGTIQCCFFGTSCLTWPVNRWAYLQERQHQLHSRKENGSTLDKTTQFRLLCLYFIGDEQHRGTHFVSYSNIGNKQCIEIQCCLQYYRGQSVGVHSTQYIVHVVGRGDGTDCTEWPICLVFWLLNMRYDTTWITTCHISSITVPGNDGPWRCLR